MSPRTRLSLWFLCVAGTLLSPVLFHLLAPWVAVVWQCLCLGGILALYATTPVDAIRLSPQTGRALILANTILLPTLCFLRLTPSLIILPLLLFALDHLRIQPAPPRHVRLSRAPGPLADWFSTLVLWSPAAWWMLAGPQAAAQPIQAVLAATPSLAVWLIAVQISVLTRERPWPRRRRLIMFPLLAAIAAAMGWFAVGES